MIDGRILSAPQEILSFDVSDWPRRIHFGAGSVGDLESLIVSDSEPLRAMVVCGRTVSTGPILEKVRVGLGSAYAGVFDQLQAQNPLPLVQAAADRLRDLGANAVVSVGGGSAIDAGKCMVMLLSSNGRLADYEIRSRQTFDKASHPRLSGYILPHIAVPTTAGSSSEVMPTAGCLDPAQGRKLLFWDEALVPPLVVLDPEVAVYASPNLTAYSGMTAVARCIESLYSGKRQPFSTALAQHALRLLQRSLPQAVLEPNDLAVRAECQIACQMSGIAAINAMVSIVHSIGHVLGGRHGLQHGMGHAILLPSAMRLLLPELGDEQFTVLNALVPEGAYTADGCNQAGEKAAQAIEALVAKLPIHRRLRDAGISEGDLGGIAAHAVDDYMMDNAPRPVSQEELTQLIQSAW